MSSLVFECTACNTKVPTSGSGCPTKSLESKFGFGKAKFGGKGVARRGWNRRNSSGSGSAHHIPLHVTNLRMAIRSRLPGNEARSDHDFAVSLAIPCVRNMLRERWYSMRRPWVITECPPVRERRRRCWYAAPFRRFARLVSIFGYMAIFERRFSCVGAPGLRFSST